MIGGNTRRERERGVRTRQTDKASGSSDKRYEKWRKIKRMRTSGRKIEEISRKKPHLGYEVLQHLLVPGWLLCNVPNSCSRFIYYRLGIENTVSNHTHLPSSPTYTLPPTSSFFTPFSLLRSLPLLPRASTFSFTPSPLHPPHPLLHPLPSLFTPSPLSLIRTPLCGRLWPSAQPVLPG